MVYWPPKNARVIKSEDEINCIRWAVAVAEHGIAKLKTAVHAGVTEAQLWGLLNYANLANNGDWHDGRMLASGPRINPWMQEATLRRVESGDLVGFDTDMIGPQGYCADISRTLHCGPAMPTRRQKELYRLALDEIETQSTTDPARDYSGCLPATSLCATRGLSSERLYVCHSRGRHV